MGPTAARARGVWFGAFGALATLSALAGCGTDTAQTATYVEPAAPATLDCTAPSTPPELPDDTAFGADAKVMPWVLQTGDYTAGQGPGVAVAARDGFRLFVNGHLLATGTASLVPTFVPLTLLPGVNAVSVVVTAVSGPPALLAVVDELERPYVSDATWKVSASPSGDWSAAGYDDSGWDSVVDHGAPEANPGCDPGPGFPAGTDAHWVTAQASGSAVFRTRITVAPVGFGAGTTGGGTETPVLVTSTSDLVAALKADGPAVVLLGEGSLDVRRTGDDVTKTQSCPTPCPDGSDMLTQNLLGDDDTCPVAMVPAERNERRIRIASNKTLVGLGRGMGLLGGSLDVADSKNVIIRNIALYGVNPGLIEAGDGISIDGADGVWIDHVTFRDISDGFIDATTGSQNLTFSWLRNEGQNPAACLGRHPRSNELADTTATIHHTLWQHVNGRAPLVTHDASRVHLFDDVVDDDVSYGIGASCGAEVLVEATSFETVTTPTSKFTCSDGSTLGLVRAQGLGNDYASDTGAHQVAGADAAEPDDTAVFSPPYAYTLDPAETARFLVLGRAGTGSRWALPITEP